MRQLAARDAAYLYLDDGHVSATIVSCWVLSHRDGEPCGVGKADLCVRLRECAAAEPLFASRLVRLPLDVGLPYWSHDPAFDVAQHVSEHVDEMTWSQAQQLLSELSSEPFDYTAPLWRAHILTDVRGVPDHVGPVTIVAIMFHHAAFDGVTWAQLTRAMLADHAAAPPHANPPAPVDEGSPSRGRLVVREVLRAPRQWSAFVTAVVSSRRRTAVPTPDRPEGATACAASTRTSWPATRFNAPIVGPRRVDYCVLNLADVTAVRQLHPGATVNDVVLAVIGRALHLHLTDLGEPPPSSLSALVPMSTRITAEGPANQFTPSVIDMHTTEADLRRRLAAVAASSAEAKAAHALKVPHANIIHVMPAMLLRIVGAISRRIRPQPTATVYANTVVANVRTRIPIDSMLGLAVHAAFGIQTLGPPTTLAHSVSSIGDRIAISITSDSAAMPDATRYIELIRNTVDEYVEAARR